MSVPITTTPWEQMSHEDLSPLAICNMICTSCLAGFPQSMIPVPFGLLKAGAVDRDDLVCLGCQDEAEAPKAQKLPKVRFHRGQKVS